MELNLKLLPFPKFLELKGPTFILECPICLVYEEVILREIETSYNFSSNGTIFVRFNQMCIPLVLYTIVHLTLYQTINYIKI